MLLFFEDVCENFFMVIRYYSLLIFLSFISVVKAQQNKKLNVLFLGNSYTYVNNLPQLIHDIALANGDTLIYDSNCPGGYTFNNHFNNATSISKINLQAWDCVILQAQSQEPSFDPSQVEVETLPYAIKLDSVINHNNDCTETVFYETWGRKNGDASNCAAYPPICTYIGMQNRLKQSYKLFADTCHTVMAPAGEAWRKSIALNPNLELYSGDQSHPVIEGSYLTACVFYEVLFHKSVLTNTYTAGIASGTVSFLQQIAHDVVNDSLMVWNIGKYNPCMTTSIADIKVDGELKIFPNPVCNELRLSIPNKFKDEIISLRIVDILGAIYLKEKGFTPSINVSGLSPGVYFVEFETKTGDTRKQLFIKQD